MTERVTPVALFLCALALAACAAEPERTVYGVDEEALSRLPLEASVELDLTRDDVAYVIDRTSVDDARVHLICPNGAGMVLSSWLAAQEPEYQHADTLVLAATPFDGDALFAVGREQCREVCKACPDGVTVCRSRCGSPELRDFVEPIDPLAHQREDDPAPPPPPQEEPGGSEGGSSGGGSDASGSSGGSSGSGAGSSGSPGGHPGI